MSDGYTKLFSTITESTIWQAPDPVRLVWITMLSMADQHGYVGASMPGLAGRARVPLEDCIAAIEVFLAPDKWSRTPDFEGRRITVADGGWILINHGKYRAIRDADTRRERSRLAMAKLRADRKSVTVNKVSLGFPQLAQAEAEAEAEAVKSKALSDKSDAAKEVLDHLNATAGRAYRPVKANISMIAARLNEGATVAECKSVIADRCSRWGSDPKMSEYLRPATLFNASKFAQYVGELGSSAASPFAGAV